MKRGRPNNRGEIQNQILQTLSSSDIPTTISGLLRNISKNLDKKISWNTIEKYTKELVSVGKVKTIRLPHSKIEGGEGLTLYVLKKE